MDDTLVQLIKAIQDIAPQVWSIYMKQVMVDVFQIGVFVVLLFVAITVTASWVRKGWEDLDEFSQPLSITIIGSLIVILFLLISEFAGRIINPQYYAIQKLLEVVSGN